MLAGAQAGDVADRSMHNGFLSQYMGSGDYNKFVTPQFSRMKHGGAPDALSHQNGPAEHGPGIAAPAQDSMAFTSMSAIAVSLLTLAAMLGVRMRRGLQQAADMSIALAPASADNILELKAQESIVRGQVGWSQQSSESSRPLRGAPVGESFCHSTKLVWNKSRL